MTFNNAGWAIDGALLNSALARTANYAGTSGAEGIVNPDDLKVSTLPTPGAGVRINVGAGVVVNRYLSAAMRNQSYVVTNSSPHDITGTDMPPVSASAQTFVVGVVVGDPEFSQVGHPFMPTTVPPGSEAGFTYVRPMVLNLAAYGGNMDAFGFPFLPLAIIVRPANTTTITGAMITDIRKMAQPRSKMDQTVVDIGSVNLNPLNGMWVPATLMTTAVPSWATRVIVTGWLEGLRLNAPGTGAAFFNFSNGFTSVNTSATNMTENAPVGGNFRRTYNIAGKFGVTQFRGQNLTVKLHGTSASGASVGFLQTDVETQAMIQVYYVEEPS